MEISLTPKLFLYIFGVGVLMRNLIIYNPQQNDFCALFAHYFFSNPHHGTEFAIQYFKEPVTLIFSEVPPLHEATAGEPGKVR